MNDVMAKINLKKLYSNKLKKRTNRNIAVDIILAVLLGLFGLFSLWPLVLITNNAFKPLNEIFLFPPRLFVHNPTLNNFRDLGVIMGNSWVPVSRYIFNTLFITFLGTLGIVIVSSMAAYPLAKYTFPGSKVMSKLVVYALMFNSTVTVIPNYIIISRIGLVDTHWALILPALSGTLGLFLMKNFIVQIPDSMLEAAKIDGANEYKTYWTIIMPLSKPAWITLIIFTFQGLWGATGGTFIYTEKLKPLNFALMQIIQAGIARTGVAGAVALLLLLVPIIVFIVSQSNVIETMASTGIKG